MDEFRHRMVGVKYKTRRSSGRGTNTSDDEGCSESRGTNWGTDEVDHSRASRSSDGRSIRWYRCGRIMCGGEQASGRGER